MGLRVCAEAGCPELIPASTRDGRCDEHRRAKDRARGSAAARGYGRAHQALRARYQQRMDHGQPFWCWRCGDTIDPSAWRLGHCDIDRGCYHGPEHVACNQATAGRVGCPHPSHD